MVGAMKKAGVLSMLFVVVPLVVVVIAEAQQPKKVPRVGLLAGGRGFGSAGGAFRHGLRELGWVAGQNMAIEFRLAEVSSDRLPQLAAELARLKVAAIVADGDPAIRAAKQTTRTIPIVLIAVGDPVREGFVASLARPGGNITGLTSISEELSGKRLELLKEAFPKVSRAAVILNPANASNLLEFREMEVTARTLGLKLQSLEVRGLGDFQGIRAGGQRPSWCAYPSARPPY
jgi:putative tryptophan/tyrosine transport system substrate-binding protein